MIGMVLVTHGRLAANQRQPRPGCDSSTVVTSAPNGAIWRPTAPFSPGTTRSWVQIGFERQVVSALRTALIR